MSEDVRDARSTAVSHAVRVHDVLPRTCFAAQPLMRWEQARVGGAVHRERSIWTAGPGQGTHCRQWKGRKEVLLLVHPAEQAASGSKPA